MKRDWDLIRKQLTDIEEDKNLFSNLPSEPIWGTQDESAYLQQLEEHQIAQRHFFGHLELLIENGYVSDLHFSKTASRRRFFISPNNNPRLTMAGHDLLDTMRSNSIWEKIKATGKSKGIELTFETIKAMAAVALKNLLET